MQQRCTAFTTSGANQVRWGHQGVLHACKEHHQQQSDDAHLQPLPATAPPKPEEAGPAQIDQPSTSKAAQASSSGQGPAPATAAPSSAAALVARRLRSVNRVTVCAPGVLLQESTADELSESATPIPAAVAALLEAARYAEVFLLAHVADDIGDALVRGALEYAGVVGQEPGQVPPQRLLFCETVQGKVSIVRQLEPGLHIDSDARTVSILLQHGR